MKLNPLPLVAALLFAAPLAPAQTATQPQAMPMEHHEHAPAVPSTSLTVSAAGKTLTFSAADLLAMPQRSVTVLNGHTHLDETYTGVGLNYLLTRAGLTTEGAGMKAVLHSYIRAEGTDHYFVVFSAGELEQSLRATDSIVALTLNGKPLKEDGAFKLIEAGEKKPARWVRNLVALRIVSVE